jgi:predicted transcriptional regulator
MERSAASTPSWVFLTNHAHVLLYIARDPDSRTRDIAERVGITERSAQRIVSELIAGGYLKRTKIGRRNRYEINRHGHLRSVAFEDFEIGPLLDVLDTADGARRPKPRSSPPAARRPS